MLKYHSYRLPYKNIWSSIVNPFVIMIASFAKHLKGIVSIWNKDTFTTISCFAENKLEGFLNIDMLV